ncbi:MAG: hypothetical protein K5872_14820 [Rhizobiaceae bacterium]|nr:hypothetical protein [Rhizobiaceae bacterium]MCV0407494.1 hypothetical protein [Rhizobiaceae bacterium]
MWSWLQDNADVVSAIASVLMLLVWAIYLHLMYNSYVRDRRSKILINRGAGRAVEARCVISNMSSSPIYIDAIRFTLRTDREELFCSLSDLDVSLSDGDDPRPQWMQGPVDSAEMIDIGSFRALIERAFGNVLERLGEEQASWPLNVQVVATFTAEDKPVAASRDFDLVPSGDTILLEPRSAGTRQIRSRRMRNQIGESLERQIQDERKSNGAPGVRA